MAKSCPNCGAKLRNWFVYCEKCGLRITDDYQNELKETVYEEPEYEEPEYEEPERIIEPEPLYEPQEEPLYEDDQVEDLEPLDHKEKDFNPYEIKNEFDLILETIEKKFDPRIVTSEDDFKNRLIQFLNSKFQNEVKGQGHTSIGGDVDVVIDGTYAIKIKILKNEGAMIFLVDLMMEYKHDFNDCAAILVDIGEITNNKIEEYINEYNELGLKTILKRAWIKNSKEEEVNVPWPSK